ncbi:hypothetical protein [Kumtagia ephedrae]|uniref:Uncharacterized protein n=1 Tax=Kumtagia ephedrae TaxID=2116701 RepID=A0A2P7SJ60_9HYPH|nr:hypothetical protein [Mesorhizobium ephedrae]PSJ62536.1 hypothetical protein C7I84_07975 [Mesorhizobium ephedrae]
MARAAFLLAAAFVPALGAAAGAQPKYDQKLERAVMERVASRIGDIRPGFGYGQQLAFIVPRERRLAGPGWQVIGSERGMDMQATGSMLTFADGDLRPTVEELRDAPSKTVSRVIQF